MLSIAKQLIIQGSVLIQARRSIHMVQQTNVLQGVILSPWKSDTVLIKVVDYASIPLDHHAVILALTVLSS
jgi:hypothetical protein